MSHLIRQSCRVRRTSCSFGSLALSALAAIACLLGAACNDTNDLGNPFPVILFSPIEGTSVFLMTLDGQMLHEWRSQFPPGYSVYLLPNGLLLRAASLPDRPFSILQGSNGGRVEMLDWDSNVVWGYDYATKTGQQHHDVYWMPSTGHVLLVAWEGRSAAEALAAGRRPATLPPGGEIWVDKIVEVDPTTDRVVWEWRIWDHLVPPGAPPADHPGLIDPNFAAAPSVDWTHANAVVYNETLDQVMVSVRNFHEVWVIDHSTTTEEAAGHTGGRLGRGGDLVYRWGNPSAYGLEAPHQLFGQHNPTWIGSGTPGAGHILVFDNGDQRARPYSRVVELEPPLLEGGSYAYDAVTGYGPSAPTWQYLADPPESFFAPFISGAQRLASGNTLVTDGPAGRFFEVTPLGETVWSYVVSPPEGTGTDPQLVFRAVRYEARYQGLALRRLTPLGALKLPAQAARATKTQY